MERCQLDPSVDPTSTTSPPTTLSVSPLTDAETRPRASVATETRPPSGSSSFSIRPALAAVRSVNAVLLPSPLSRACTPAPVRRTSVATGDRWSRDRDGSCSTYQPPASSATRKRRYPAKVDAPRQVPREPYVPCVTTLRRPIGSMLATISVHAWPSGPSTPPGRTRHRRGPRP